jgi:hypothetical protein
MIQFVVAIKDRAADVFVQPFTVAHRNIAVRDFTDQVNNPESMLSKHPDDYDLWLLAEFDNNTGVFDAAGGAVVLVRGKDVKSS